MDTNAAANTVSVEIEGVTLSAVRTEGTLRAFAKVDLAGPIKSLNSIKVIAGRNGTVFAGLPSQKGSKGDRYFPLIGVSDSFQRQLNEAVNAAYQKEIERMPVA